MSTLSTLLAGAQAFTAGQMPATIRIGPQTYAAACGGRKSGLDLAEFGGTATRTIAFWLPAIAFTTAGQPVPRPQSTLTCTAPAAFAGDYLIESVIPDAAGATLFLRCAAPAQ